MYAKIVIDDYVHPVVSQKEQDLAVGRRQRIVQGIDFKYQKVGFADSREYHDWMDAGGPVQVLFPHGSTPTGSIHIQPEGLVDWSQRGEQFPCAPGISACVRNIPHDHPMMPTSAPFEVIVLSYWVRTEGFHDTFIVVAHEASLYIMNDKGDTIDKMQCAFAPKPRSLIRNRYPDQGPIVGIEGEPRPLIGMKVLWKDAKEVADEKWGIGVRHIGGTDSKLGVVEVETPSR